MCSHSLAPTSSGPGIADLPCVAVSPISLAYSGLIAAVVPVLRVARCQIPRKAADSAIASTAARKRREKVIALSPPAAQQERLSVSRRLPDLEAGQIIV